MTMPMQYVEEYLTATEQVAMAGHCLALCNDSPVHRTLISYLAASVNVNWSVCCVHSSLLIRLQLQVILALLARVSFAQAPWSPRRKKIYFQFCAPQISTTHQCYSLSQLPIAPCIPSAWIFFTVFSFFSFRLLPFMLFYHIIISSRKSMLINFPYWCFLPA